MYEVDHQDRLRGAAFPSPAPGDPDPVLIQKDGRVLLAYRTASVFSSDSSVVVLEFIQPHATVFGAPNDEAITGHPLASRGLAPYRVFEVTASSWLRVAMERNRVHPQHRDEHFSGLRHFLVTFHDSTFECLAADARILGGGQDVWVSVRDAWERQG